MGGRTHAFSTKRISDSEWRHFHRHARDFQHLLIVKTWGLIGSRSWPNSSPNFLFKKICVCNFALLPLAICHICPTHRTIFLWMFLNSETPEILFDIDLSQGFRYNGMGKGHRKGKHEEEVLVRTPELERRYTAPPSATQHNVASYICFACLCTSGKSSGLLKNKWYNWNAFGNFPNSWHGYLDIALSFYTPTCLLHWMNSFGSTNLQNIWIQVSVTFSIAIMNIIHTTIWICAIFCPFCLCGVV